MKTIEQIKTDFIEIRDILRDFVAKYEVPTVGDWLDFCEHNNFYEKANNDMTEINGIDVISDMYSGDISEDTIINHIKIEDYGALSNVDYYYDYNYPEDKHRFVTAEIRDKEGYEIATLEIRDNECCEIATLEGKSLNDKDFIDNLKHLLDNDNRDYSFEDYGDIWHFADGINEKNKVIVVCLDDTEFIRSLLTKDRTNPFKEFDKIYGEEFDLEFYAEYNPLTDKIELCGTISIYPEDAYDYLHEHKGEKILKCWDKCDNVVNDNYIVLSDEEKDILKNEVKTYIGYEGIQKFWDCLAESIAEKILKGEKEDLSNYDNTIVRQIIEKIYDKAIEAINADTGDKLKEYDNIYHKEFIVNGKEICLQYTDVDSGNYYEPPTSEITFFSKEFIKPKEFGVYGEYYEEPCMEVSINLDNDDIDDKKFIDTIMDYAYNEGRFKKNIEDTLNPPNSKNNKIQKEL